MASTLPVSPTPVFTPGGSLPAGLTVPQHELVQDADGVPGLLIRRFDRTTVDGQPRMLAVEDGCQAADLPPAAKYRVGADRAFAALATLCEAPSAAARELTSRRCRSTPGRSASCAG